MFSDAVVYYTFKLQNCFCFTSTGQDSKRSVVEERLISLTSFALAGKVFTSAGVVAHSVAATIGSVSSTSGNLATTTSSVTNLGTSATLTKSEGMKQEHVLWKVVAMAGLIVFCGMICNID